MKIEQNKFFTILLVLSSILFGVSSSFAKETRGLGVYHNGERINNNSNIWDVVSDDLITEDIYNKKEIETNFPKKNVFGYALKKKGHCLEVVKTINLFINENLKGLVELINIPNYDKMDDYELNSIINNKLNNIYPIIKKKKLYSKFLPFIVGIAEEDLLEPLSGICEFIKANKKRKEFKNCSMPENCFLYKSGELSSNIYKCFYDTSFLSCEDIFDVYNLTKKNEVYYYDIEGKDVGGQIFMALRLGKESKPTSFPSDSLVYLQEPVKFYVSSFCNNGSITSKELDYFFNVLKRIHKLSDTDTTAYATIPFLRKCGHKLLGESFIKKECRRKGKEYIEP